jgi:hypothetical protein
MCSVCALVTRSFGERDTEGASDDDGAIASMNRSAELASQGRGGDSGWRRGGNPPDVDGHRHPHRQVSWSQMRRDDGYRQDGRQLVSSASCWKKALDNTNPNPLVEAPTLMLGPVHGRGRSTYTRGRARFPVSTCRFCGPAFVLLRPMRQGRGGGDAVRHADLSGRCARATGRAP